MKKHLLITLAFICLFSCRKENNDPPIPADGNAFYLGALTLNALQVSPLDMSAVPQFSGAALPFGLLVRKDIYDSGHLSYDTVILGKVLDIRFFITPDKPAGAYVLHIPAGGNDYLNLDLTIQSPAPIADPASYLAGALDSLFTAETELEEIGKALEDMPFASNYAKDISRLKYHANAARNWVAVCNEQEKAVVAKFLKANEQIFASTFNPLDLIDSTNINRCIHPLTRAQAITVTKYSIAFVTSLLVFYGSIDLLVKSGIGTVEGLVLAAIGGGVAVYSFNKLRSMHVISLDQVWECFGVYVDEILPRNGFELQSNKDYALVTSVEWRTLYKGDLASSEPVVVDFVGAMNQARDAWNFLQSVIPKFLDSAYPGLEGIEDFKVKKLNEGATYLRVENVSNPLVILKKTKVVNDQLVVTFTTTADTPQDFTFDLVFDYESTLLKKSVAAKIIPIGLPVVQTLAVSNIGSSSAQTGGNVTDDGGADVSARGVCWSTSPGPTLSNSHDQNGSGKGSFNSTISGLTDKTTYYVRAYATNNQGTAYGNEVSFTTSSGCSTVLVSGASCTDPRIADYMIGQYNLNGTFNGKPRYTHQNGKVQIVYESSAWVIWAYGLYVGGSGSTPVGTVYINYSTSATMPESGWEMLPLFQAYGCNPGVSVQCQ